MDQSEKVAQLTKPLYKHFGINGFNYARFYVTGEALYLGSDRLLDEKLLEKHLTKKSRLSAINALASYPHVGYFLTDVETNACEAKDEIFRELLQEHGYHHDFVIFNRMSKSQENVLEVFRYSAPLSKNDINHFYINNLELLTRFSRHVTQELQDTIQSLSLIQPTSKEKQLAETNFQRLLPKHTQQKDFVKATGMHYPKYKELSDISLSPRQKEIIHWYLLGKTAADTATILNLSLRTIHDYFERLKRKFNCYSKSQLLLKLIDSDLLSPNDWRAIYPKSDSQIEDQ